MEITEVRIKLMDEPGERLQAFCSITFDDCFVIRDLKIIEGTNGPFVAMPSRKLTSHCQQCGAKNHLCASYCNDCGAKMNPNRAPLDDEGCAKLYADIAHPINSACREMIQERIIREFREEQQRAKLPGYVSRYDDFDVHDFPPPRHSRAPGRTHPTTNYIRPAHDSAPREMAPMQLTEQPMPMPHKKPMAQAASSPVSSGAADNSDGAAAADAAPKNFGAGIF